MILILISLIIAAIGIAILTIRYRISVESLARSGIARDDITTAGERGEQSWDSDPTKQFLVVVLPDGKVVTTR
jgi:hypothetical protein